MPDQSTNTVPIPSNEGDYLKLANELKSQFDEEKAKWKAKFDVLEYQNNSMKGFIKKINNVTDEIIKTDNKRMFDEIDNGTSGSSEPPRRRRRRVRRSILVGRRDGQEMSEAERGFLRFMVEQIGRNTTPVTDSEANES
jgi:hypothetical protein